MQIKLEECRKFITNEKTFQEILQFFRNKLNVPMLSPRWTISTTRTTRRKFKTS
jgi:hypothetical protein